MNVQLGLISFRFMIFLKKFCDFDIKWMEQYHYIFFYSYLIFLFSFLHCNAISWLISVRDFNCWIAAVMSWTKFNNSCRNKTNCKKYAYVPTALVTYHHDFRKSFKFEEQICKFKNFFSIQSFWWISNIKILPYFWNIYFFRMIAIKKNICILLHIFRMWWLFFTLRRFTSFSNDKAWNVFFIHKTCHKKTYVLEISL